MPLMLGSWVIYIPKLIFGGTDLRGRLHGHVAGDVAKECYSIIEEFAELTVTGVSTIRSHDITQRHAHS
jgi:hypothetical protein